MKQFLLILSFFAALIIGGIFTIAIPKAEKQIVAELNQLGFNDIEIKRTYPSLFGLSVSDISLDKNGFNTIEGLKVNIFWPTAFFAPQTRNLKIEKLHFSIVPSEIRKISSQLNNFLSRDALKINKIDVKNIIIDLALRTKALRFEGDFHFYNNNAFKGTLNGLQHDLSFDAVFAGTINSETQKLSLDTSMQDLKINIPPVKVARGQGWFSFTHENKKNHFGAQIDAGSGSFFNIPMTNLTLLIGQDDKGYPVLFRSGIAGLDNAKLTSDFFYTRDALSRKFNAQLYIPDHDNFVTLLKSQNLIKESKDLSTLDTQDYNVTINYMTEKRFAGGPLPFDLSLNNQLEGTLLIYPDSYDVRGTVETEEDLLNYLRVLFNISDKNISDNVIRLDSNLKSLVN